MRTQRETDLEDEVKRLTERNKHLEARFGYLEGDWDRRNHIIERLQARVDVLEGVKSTANQFMLEVSHAMQCGPGWYTRGEDGLRGQIYMWIDKMRKALEGE